MNITSLLDHPQNSEIDVATAALSQGGIEFTVVCEGPEPTCGDGIPAAA